MKQIQFHDILVRCLFSAAIVCPQCDSQTLYPTTALYRAFTFSSFLVGFFPCPLFLLKLAPSAAIQESEEVLLVPRLYSLRFLGPSLHGLRPLHQSCVRWRNLRRLVWYPSPLLFSLASILSFGFGGLYPQRFISTASYLISSGC